MKKSDLFIVPEEWGNFRLETLAIHGGGLLTDTEMNPGIQRSTAMPMLTDDRSRRLFSGKEAGHFYGPISNKTEECLERRLASLHGAGAALTLASGMTAIKTLFEYLGRNGGHIVSSSKLYGGVYDLFKKILPAFGIETTFVENPYDLREWDEAIRKNTAAFHVEIPSNPLIDVFDGKRIAELAHKRGIVAVADTTLGTPFLIRPFDLGFDFVGESLSKYFSDGEVWGGDILSRSKEWMDRFRTDWYRDVRSSMSTDTADTIRANTESLGPRIEAHCFNAEMMVKYLSQHPKVKKVFYPTVGPRAEANKKLMPNGFGGLLAFEVEGGGEAAKIFVDSLKLFWLAPNIGEPRSLMLRPWVTTHNQMDSEELLKVGIWEATIRFSMGREAWQNQVFDCHQAFQKI